MPYKKGRKGLMKHGLAARIDLDALDGRTSLGKAVKTLGRELRAYVGEPTPASELLIHRIVAKTVKLAMYELRCLTEPLQELPSVYMPLSNSLRLDLQALAGLAGRAWPPDLKDYIESRYRVVDERERDSDP